MTTEITLPPILDEMQPFWDALHENRFVLLRCSGCGTWYWPFAACRRCANEPFFANMRFEPASGRGKVFSFTIPRWTFNPSFPAPYVYALVELEEGPMMPTNIVGCAPEAVRVGLPVEVAFVKLSDDITLPKFRPRKA